MLFLLWYVYKWLFDLFLEKYLLAMYSSLFKKKKKKTAVELWTTMFYILQANKKLKKQNLTYISLWWASLSPNLLMFISVLSLNSELNG